MSAKTSGIKRRHFSIEEKSCIIAKLKSGVTNKTLAKEYGVSQSTISTIWKDREKVKMLFNCNYLKMKRARCTKHQDLEKALLKWFRCQRENNMHISGPILQQKANDFAQLLGYQDFVCSSSWIQRFRVRHNILGGQGRALGSTKVSDCEEVEWLKRQWPILCAEYKPDEIFNANETALFYNITPEQTSKFKDEKCYNGNWSHARLTVMVAANMTGTSKRKLLVIGKPTPEYFENMLLPVTYESNGRSWMTSEIFEKWLRDWDDELKEENKKIILLVDNCPAHTFVTNLEAIQLVFLPPDATNLVQPMDRGIIRCLKTHYRKLQISKMAHHNRKHKNISVLDAILMLAEAWEKITQRTIVNCFRLAGFKDDEFSDTVEPLAQGPSEDDHLLAKLAVSLQLDSLSEVEDYIEVDENVSICAPATDDDFVPEPQEPAEYQNEGVSMPSLNEGLYAINVLRKIVNCSEQFKGTNYDEMLVKMHRELEIGYSNVQSSQSLKSPVLGHKSPSPAVEVKVEAIVDE